MRIWDWFFARKNARLKAPEIEKFILCIDGGGMRGLVPLAILKEFERILKEKGFSGNLAEAFDMIAGTSTGGLISLCLTCTDNPNPDALISSYLNLGPKIFPHTSVAFKAFKSIADSKYSSNGIESIIEQWFGDKKLSEAKTPTLIMSYDLSDGKEAIFKSWDRDCVEVKTAARATSAAPTYFSPLAIDNHIYVDGGIIANNPSIYAYIEAKKLWPECKKFNILSLSTAGNYHTMTVEQTVGLLNWVAQLSPMYGTAQKRTADYVLNNSSDVKYTRIDGKMNTVIEMDETNPQILQQLITKGQEMAMFNRGYLEEYAKRLVSKKPLVNP